MIDTTSLSSTKQTVKRKIADLKPHPLQHIYFPNHPTDDIAEFAETLKRGLDHAVEVTPDGMIICGHRRTAAARYLGWEEIHCWVRHDLKGNLAIEERFLEDNLERRHLSKLAIARCYQRLREVAEEQWRAGQRDGSARPRGDTRDMIGKRLGLSGRTLDRLLNVLHAPQAVQDAFESGNLPLVMAEKVARLPKGTQREVADEITTGKDAQSVVAAALRAHSQRRTSNERCEMPAQVRCLMQCLNKVVPPLMAHHGDFPAPGPKAMETIGNAIALLTRLKRSGSKATEAASPDTCPDPRTVVAKTMSCNHLRGGYHQEAGAVLILSNSDTDDAIGFDTHGESRIAG